MKNRGLLPFNFISTFSHHFLSEFSANMKIIIFALCTLLTISSAFPEANEDQYKYCLIAGYAYGSGDSFIGSLAAGLAIENGLFATHTCKSAYQQAFRDGNQTSQSGRPAIENHQMVENYTSFKRKIEKSILRNAGF